MDAGERVLLRYVVASSALLSLIGASMIIFSALRFRELSKRFFAIRLIFFLASTNAAAAAFNIAGAFFYLDTTSLDNNVGGIASLCQLHAVGLLYCNLASIMWTSCFSYTLYRDVVPAPRRPALRSFERYFHALCWPLPATMAGGVTFFGFLGERETWCATDKTLVDQSQEYLIAFYLPLLGAFFFNLIAYTAVLRHSRQKRVSRITSLYLLGFAVVWLPSLLCRLQVALSPSHMLAFPFALLEAICMPLQGALNALVYGWSLPSIRDVYRNMLLGPDGLLLADERSPSSGSGTSSWYDPPSPFSPHEAFNSQLPAVFAHSAALQSCNGGCESRQDASAYGYGGDAALQSRALAAAPHREGRSLSVDSGLR